MSNSKHSMSSRGEWPPVGMQCDVRPASLLYLCTLGPHEGHSPPAIHYQPAQDNSEESAKQKQTRDDQFLLRLIGDHHAFNGWVEDKKHTFCPKLQVFMFYFYTRKFLCT